VRVQTGLEFECKVANIALKRSVIVVPCQVTVQIRLVTPCQVTVQIRLVTEGFSANSADKGFFIHVDTDMILYADNILGFPATYFAFIHT